MESYSALLQTLREPTRELRKHVPEAWDGFAALQAGAVKDGVLPRRVRELAAVAMAVVQGCDGCIGYHARAAVRKGATPEEMAEMLAVALLMAGGPASVYAPRAWAAFCEFYEVHEELHAADRATAAQTAPAVPV